MIAGGLVREAVVAPRIVADVVVLVAGQRRFYVQQNSRCSVTEINLAGGAVRAGGGQFVASALGENLVDLERARLDRMQGKSIVTPRSMRA